jgi:hypothetical protein
MAVGWPLMAEPGHWCLIKEADIRLYLVLASKTI